ncbi:MAG: LysR family transcriptional regulator [Steroidobacteraceae bacterium]|jgi:DNA-binding transcriptional LysR family regulator
MDKVQEMSSFVAVIDAGSFVAAAHATNLSKAAVSRHVTELEQRLGTCLLQRTTRRLSVTSEGQAFYARCKEVLAAIDEAESEVTATRGEPSGLIRVNAPLTFGVLQLAPLWGRFADRYPKVSLDVSLTNRIVDLVEEGYDIAIRISAAPSAMLIARKLASTRMILCASGRYLERHGVPRQPQDLAAHRVISYTCLATQDEWQFAGPQGPVSARVNACIHTNNGDTCRRAALDHQGIVLQPDFLVGGDIRDGSLVALMPEFRGNEIGIYAVYPSRKHLSLKVRRLIDFLTESFRDVSWSPRPDVHP